MNEVVERVRRKYPQYQDLNDQQLTLAIGRKFPAYLDGSYPKFERQFKLVDEQAKAAAENEGIGTFEFAAHPTDPKPSHAGGWQEQAGLGLTQGLANLSQQANTALAELNRNNPLNDLARAMGAKEEDVAAVTNQLQGASDVASEAAAQVGALRQETGGPQVVGDIAHAGTSILPTLAAAPAGLPTMIAAAGVQSFGAAMDEGTRAYLQQGARSVEEAREAARPAAVAQGVITALITGAFGRTGVEAAGGAVKAGAFRPAVKEFFKQAGLEATEESIDQLAQVAVQAHTYRDDVTLKEALAEAAKAGGLGGVVGGVAQIPGLAGGKPKGESTDDLIARGEAAMAQAQANLKKLGRAVRGRTVNDGQLAQPITGEFIDGGPVDPAPGPVKPIEPAPEQTPEKVSVPEVGTFPMPEAVIDQLDKVETKEVGGGDSAQAMAEESKTELLADGGTKDISSPASAPSPPAVVKRLGLSFTKAREWALKHIRGKYLNRETGLEITVSREGIRKVTQIQAATKSANRADHISALQAVPKLLENATKVEDRPSEKGGKNIDRILRFTAPLAVEGSDYDVLLTVKRHVKPPGHKFYSYELSDVEIRKPSGSGRSQGGQGDVSAGGQSNTSAEGSKQVIAPEDDVKPAKAGEAKTNIQAAVNRATLPRIIDDATKRPPAGPVHAQQIREYMQQALDVPFRVGAGQKAGFFRPKAEVIRAKEGLLNSLTVATHEVGHYLHQVMLDDAPVQQYNSELMALGAPGQGNSSAKPNSTAEYIRGEGVAEFVRLSLTDPAQAMAQAPKFSAFFAAYLNEHHRPVADILDHVRQMVADYVNQPVAAELKAMIDWDPKPARATFREWFDKVYADWFTELAPMERAERRLIKLGLPPEDARRASQLATNYLGGWVGKVEYSIYQRQLDYAGQDVGPGLQEILSGVPDINEFAMWSTGLRILEKSKQGKATGFNEHKLRELGEWIGKRRKQYLPAYKKLNQFLSNELKMAVDAGLLSAEEAGRIKAKNQFYVPFQRDRKTLTGRGRGGGRGFIDVPKPLRRFVGGDGRIYNPLESVIKNLYSLRDAVERNRIAEAFVSAIERTQGGGRVADPIAKKLKPQDMTVPPEVLEQWLVDHEMESASGNEARELIQDNPLSFRVWQMHHRQSDPSQGIFQVWRKGKQQRWQTDDNDLYRALQLADATEASILNRLPIKPLVWLTRALRSGATLTLEFMARNINRDPITAAVYSKHGFVPFVDTVRGVFDAVGRTKHYWNFVKAGGRYADFVAQDRKDLRAKLEEVTNTETATEMVVKWGNPLLTLQKMSETMELSTRVAEFRRAKEMGKSDVEAANAAKDVTLNFSRGGFKGRIVNRLVPFFNAQLQDIDKFLREHDPRNARNALKVSMKGFAYITVPSILTWWLGRDDEELQKLPDWRKQFFWNLRVGGEIMSIPKPFLLGQIYGTSVERGLDYLDQKDPNALRKWVMDTLSMANPIPLLNPDVMPAGAKPMSEAWANYSFFREAPLESPADQRLPKQFRATPQTSESAKYVSRLMAGVLGDEELTVSPIVIDNSIRGTLGGMGKYGTDALDFLAAKTGLIDVPPRPIKKWTELPGARAFFKSPYASNQDVQRFYDGLARAERSVNTLRDLQTIMDPNAAAYWKRNGERIVFYESGALREARKVADHLATVNRAMLVVRESRGWSPEQKSEKLQELARLRNDLAASALKWLHPKDLERVR